MVLAIQLGNFISKLIVINLNKKLGCLNHLEFSC